MDARSGAKREVPWRKKTICPNGKSMGFAEKLDIGMGLFVGILFIMVYPLAI